MTPTLGILLTFLVVWVLIAVGVVTVTLVLDFLVLGHRGRLDWIANLFRKEKDQDKKV